MKQMHRLWVACLLLLAAIPAPAQTPDPPGRLVDVGGYRVHLYCTGSGSPTVLVAGAGFSFDWALVQPEVARFTTICTYDVSGTAWSDPGPPLTCRARVDEIHKLVRAAHLDVPLVLVGLSIGGCVVRLYAAEYPSDVAGLVIVDHAFRPDLDPDAGKQRPTPSSTVDSLPVLISQTPIALTVEDMSNFQRLPERIQHLHRWAAGLHPNLPTWEAAEECLAQLKTAAPGPFSLHDLPLAVVSTANPARGYERLQNELIALSHRSIQLIAEKSFHAVEIDQPEVVVDATRRVVDRVRHSSGQ